MRLSALEVFVELSEAESFRQLARAHGVKAGTISRQVESLEYYFRTELFDRNSEGITLTEAGRHLLDHAKSILAAMRTARNAVEDLRGLDRGRVTILAGGAPAAGILAPVIAELHTDFPGLNFCIETASASDIFDAVADGRADIGLTMFSPETDKVEIRVSIFVEHYVLVSPGHPLAGLRTISLRQLAQTAVAVGPNGYGSRHRLNEITAKAKIGIVPAFETPSLEIQKELALRGAAALVLPLMSCRREIDSGALIAIPFEAHETMGTTVDLCVPRTRPMSFACRKLQTAISQALEKANRLELR